MKDMNVSVKAESKNATQTEVKARNFKMIIDEPQNLGGTDEGANPVEYVLGALSGCLTVVGHLVAKEMGFTLRGMSMEMNGNLDPARLMGKSQEERAGFKGIEVNIHADADADEETLKKWVEQIENRCPVSDNLSNETPVTISALKLVNVSSN
ncbi:MAG: OsmC family protein [Bacteroidales bacterium]